MSRYTGPRVKILRLFGMSLPGLTRKTVAEGRYQEEGCRKAESQQVQERQGRGEGSPEVQGEGCCQEAQRRW